MSRGLDRNASARYDTTRSVVPVLFPGDVAPELDFWQELRSVERHGA